MMADATTTNTHQTRLTSSHGYDSTCSLFDSAGMPIFAYDAPANKFPALKFEPSAGNIATFRQFTGKERDTESGLDYFGARFYGSALGRFSSPDEPLGDQSPADPQSWNLYSYVRNSPLVNTDPTGEDCVTTSDQTDKSVTVTIAAGTCNGNGGTYVNGTVDKGSLTYNGTSVGFSYASYDSSVSLGAGTINLGPSQGGDINPFGLAVIQSVGRQTNSMYGLMGTFAGGSLLGGGAVAGGLAFTASGAGLTTIGAITPLLPAVPSALEKLQKIGLSLEEANQLVESPDSQKLVDNLNSGNINVIKEVGGKLIRVTFDPTGSRIISAGQVRANSITNGIANGRFTPR